MNNHIKVEQHQHISAVSPSVCDDCNRKSTKVINSSEIESETIEAVESERQIDKIGPVEDEDGYCEIEDIR